jgi:hypothetical protein
VFCGLLGDEYSFSSNSLFADYPASAMLLADVLSLPVVVGTGAASSAIILGAIAYLCKSTRKQAVSEKCNPATVDLDHLIAEMHAAEAALEQAAQTSVRVLSKNDLTELKGLHSPASAVKSVLEAVCILFDVAPVEEIKTSLNTAETYLDYFGPAKRLMGNPAFFLSRLEHYDKDHIDQAVIDRLARYVDDPDFHPERVGRAANAAKGLCAWVHAIVSYHHLNNELKVKRAAVALLRHGGRIEHGGQDSMCSRWTRLWYRFTPNKIMHKEAIPLLAKPTPSEGDRKQAAKEMAAMKKQAPPRGNASPFPTIAAPTEMRAHIPAGGFDTCVPEGSTAWPMLPLNVLDSPTTSQLETAGARARKWVHTGGSMPEPLRAAKQRRLARRVANGSGGTTNPVAPPAAFFEFGVRL